jgi:hypothetical protein
MKNWFILAAALTGPLALAVHAGAEPPVGIRAFEAVPGERREAADTQPYATATRFVTINTAALFGDAGERGAIATDRITLNLFEDRTIEAFREVRDLGVGNTPTWFGQLPEEIGGYALFVMTEGGYVSGKVHSTNFGLYEIAPAGPDGICVIRQINEPAMPGCGNRREHDVIDAPANPGAGPAQFDMPAPDAGGRRGVVAPPPSTPGTAGTERGGTFIFADVLIAYTPAARTAVGGTNSMVSILTAMVADSNTAYLNSDVDLRIRAAAFVETSYVESASDMSLDLSRLQSVSDGNMDELHPLRNQLGADLISLIVVNASGGACGIGYLMTNVSNSFASSAVSVTSRTCISNLTFHHELGHNMGLSHDRDNAGASSRPYAYGYRTPNNQYRTVMAYAPGTRVNYFSNPNISFGGLALGNPVNHPTNPAFNALALNDNASTIAAWRNIFTAPPSAFALIEPAIGSTTANRSPLIRWAAADQADYYRLEVDNNANFASPEILQDPFSGTQFQVPARTLAPGTLYNWRVTAINPLGQTIGNPSAGTFTTPANVPGAFSLVTPASAAGSVSLSPTFAWQDAVDSDTFTIQVDDDPAFGSPAINLTNVQGTQYTWFGTPLLPLTNYHWRMTAVNTIGSTPSTGGSQTFTTAGAPPAAFALAFPADGANITTLTPTLTWQPSVAASSYRLIIDNDLNLASPIINQSGIASTSFQIPAGQLQNQTRYYWQVIASNISGTATSSPTIATFATVAPNFCQGDANRDRSVNFVDITAVLAGWGTAGPQGDANNDGAVNFVDVTAVLASFGAACP